MNRAAILIALVLCFARVSAAGGPPDAAWVVRSNSTFYGDIVCEGASSDRDGNLYLTGTIDNRKSFDIITFKYDPALGETLWTAVWNGPDDGPDGPVGCVADTLGNLFLAGYSHNGTDFDIVVLKYNTSNGQQLWVKKYDTGPGCNEYPAGLVLDRAGGLYVAATCDDDTIWNHYWERRYPLVIKFNAETGDTEWARHYTEIDTFSQVSDVSLNSDGNIIIPCTRHDEYNGMNDTVLVFKIEPLYGDTLWVRRHRLGMNTIIGSACDASGDFCLLGTRIWMGPNYVVKCHGSNGDTVWIKELDNSMELTDCVMDSAGYLYIAASNNEYLWAGYKVHKLSPAGDSVWVRVGDESGWDWLINNDTPYLLTPVRNGEMHLAGSATYHDGSMLDRRIEFRCLRVDAATGDTSNSFHLGSRSSGGWNTANDCKTDASCWVYVAGSDDMNYTVRACNAEDGSGIWKTTTRYHLALESSFSEARSLALSEDGSLFTTGYSYNEPSSFHHAARTRGYMPGNGDSIWSAGYIDDVNYGRVVGNGCCLDTAGFLYITGVYNNWEDNNSFIVKYNPIAGDTIWKHNYSNWPYMNSFYGVCVSDLNTIYAAGSTGGKCLIAASDASTGDTIFTRGYVFFGNCCNAARSCGVKGNILYLAGQTAPTGDCDFLVVKLALPDCDTVWVRRYDGAAGRVDIANAVAVDDSGNIYVTGTSHNGDNYDILTVKYTPNGDTVWSARYDGPFHGNDYGEGCAVDSLGNLFVTGYSRTARGADIVLLRYDAGFTGVAGVPVSGGFRYTLGGIYPNPLHEGRAKVDFTLASPGKARVVLYNVAGQRVRILAEGSMQAGAHHVYWDGRNESGRRVSAGVYICRAESGGWRSARKLVIVK